MEMVKNEIVLAAAILVLSAACTPKVQWRSVPMDGHRSGAECLTAENIDTGLGRFTDSTYVMPSGATFALASPSAQVARALMAVQPHMAPLKKVVGHSARMMMNLRDNPDLPLGNLFADVLRAYGTRYFGVPMDFAITNFGGIRVRSRTICATARYAARSSRSSLSSSPAPRPSRLRPAPLFG